MVQVTVEDVDEVEAGDGVEVLRENAIVGVPGDESEDVLNPKP